MKPIVFFSYSRQDSEFALKLGKDLRAAGISIWLDQLDIKPGERWDVAIEKALAECSRILVILSPISVESTNVMDEVSYSLEERRVVIPVLHRDCEIPFRLRRLQHTDFRTDYQAALDKLLQFLNAVPPETIQAGLQDKESQVPGPPHAVVAAAMHKPETGSKGMATRGPPSRTVWVIATAVVVVILGIWITLKMMPPPSNIAQMPAKNDGATSAPPAQPAASAKSAEPDKPPPIAKSGKSVSPPKPAKSAEPDKPPPIAKPDQSETVTPLPIVPPVISEAPRQIGNEPSVRLVNIKSGLCLTVAGGGMDLNLQAVQYPCDDHPSRFWSTNVVPDTDMVTIKNLNSGLCLTIAGGGSERNTPAVQYHCDGDPSRNWKLREVDEKTFRLVNVHSNLCLTIAGGGIDRNAVAVQFPCDGDPSRDWQIRRERR